MLFAPVAEGARLLDTHFIQVRLASGRYQRCAVCGKSIDVTLFSDQVELAAILDGIRRSNSVAAGSMAVMETSSLLALLMNVASMTGNRLDRTPPLAHEKGHRVLASES